VQYLPLQAFGGRSGLCGLCVKLVPAPAGVDVGTDRLPVGVGGRGAVRKGCIECGHSEEEPRWLTPLLLPNGSRHPRYGFGCDRDCRKASDWYPRGSLVVYGEKRA